MIARLRTNIADPDTVRMFENASLNTLNTQLRWKGITAKTNPDYPIPAIPNYRSELALVIPEDELICTDLDCLATGADLL